MIQWSTAMTLLKDAVSPGAFAKLDRVCRLNTMLLEVDIHYFPACITLRISFVSIPSTR